MVVDYMFSRHLLLNMDQINGEQLTMMKSAMVNRNTLAFVALKNGFDKFIKVNAGSLSTKSMKEFTGAVTSNEVGSHSPQMSTLPMLHKNSEP